MARSTSTNASSNDPTADAVFQELVAKINREYQRPDMTQAQLARQMGVGQSTVSQWLNGTRGGSATLNIIMRCYRALGGSMADLLRNVLGEEKAGPLIAASDEDPDLMEGVIKLLAAPNSPEAKQWRNLTLFLSGVGQESESDEK